MQCKIELSDIVKSAQKLLEEPGSRQQCIDKCQALREILSEQHAGKEAAKYIETLLYA